MWVRIALAVGVLSAAHAVQAQDCVVPKVVVARWWSQWTIEEAQLQLVDCDYEPNMAALDELSILARPHGTDRPEPDAIQEGGDMVAPGIARLDPGLLVRLQAIADSFPGHRIEIVSGYRPRARRTSRHRHARALDIRVVDVSKEQVSELAHTLPETGVGYYPNSDFTHVDVREERAYWIDTSGPGERARYVAHAEVLSAVDRVLRESGSVRDVDVERE